MRLLLTVLIFLSFNIALAEAKRIGLVIGNDNYSQLPPDYQLKKARNDARAVAEVFKELGFEITSGFDLSRRDINFKLSTIANKIEPGDEVMFFFAGHGVRIDGLNYLLPADIPSIDQADKTILKSESIWVDEITRLFQQKGARLSILVLDACRNNPYKDNKKRAVGGTRGLAVMNPPAGTLVLFSAGAGQAALDRLSDDDANPNSVFTRTFLPLVSQKGLELSRLARNVKAEVNNLARQIGHTQIPAIYNEVIGDIYLSGKADEKIVVPAAKTADELLWKTIHNSTKATDYEFFLKEHPQSRYGSLAKFKLRQLKGAQVALLSPVKIPNSDALKNKAWIGVNISKNTSIRINGTSPRGLIIINVFKKSPAENAGLIKGDIIHEIDNIVINDVAKFVQKVVENKVGTPLPLTIYREGVEKRITATLTSRYEFITGLMNGAEKGNQQDMITLAGIYKSEGDLGKDINKTIKWYEKAVSLGNSEAMYQLGSIYQLNTYGKMDKALAIENFKKAAENGHINSMLSLADLYRIGWGTTKDHGKALEWYQKAAEKNSNIAQNSLADMYRYGRGTPKNITRAIELYKKAADSGHGTAMNNLGTIYRTGENTGKDPALALSWYKKAADAGNTYAYHNLGYMFQTGDGITKDYQKTLNWYEKAATIKYSNEKYLHPGAIYNIATIYTKDDFPGKNTTKAVEWYTKAANAGHVNAMWYLGYLYEYGQWVTKDQNQSHSWYQKGADKGDAFSMYNVGQNYDKGRAVGKDPKVAAQNIANALEKKHKGTIDYFRKYWKEISRATRKELQAILTTKGYYSGKIDGDFGPGSMKAIDKLTGK